MSKYKRIFTIVIDSLGIGAMPDSKEYGDVNVDTLGHIAESVENFNIPNLQRMGISSQFMFLRVQGSEFGGYVQNVGMNGHSILRQEITAREQGNVLYVRIIRKRIIQILLRPF